MIIPGVPKPNSSILDEVVMMRRELRELARRVPNLELTDTIDGIDADTGALDARVAALESPDGGDWVRSTTGTVATGLSKLAFPDPGTGQGVTYANSEFTLAQQGMWRLDATVRLQGVFASGTLSCWFGDPADSDIRHRLATTSLEGTDPQVQLSRRYTTPTADTVVALWVSQDTGTDQTLHVTEACTAVGFTYLGT